MDIEKEERDSKIQLNIKLHLEVVVDGLSYKFDDNHSVIRRGG